jgi:hypothetical protein
MALDLRETNGRSTTKSGGDSEGFKGAIESLSRTQSKRPVAAPSPAYDVRGVFDLGRVLIMPVLGGGEISTLA